MTEYTMVSVNYQEELKRIQLDIAEQRDTKRKTLKELDFVVLDNSIRETTVGQLRGHTLENKIEIYKEIKKCGFSYQIVANFDHMTRVGETFCQWLVKNDEDRSGMFAFSNISDSVENERLVEEKLPVSLQKCKKYGIPNVQFEFDLIDSRVKWGETYTIEELCALLKKRLNWCFENLSPKSKVLFEFRDFPFAMNTDEGALRVLQVVKFLSNLSNRGWGICFEEPGKYLPEEVGAWCASVRRVMDKCGWHDGNLLVHLHERWGLAQTSQLECLANGANGIWAGVCEEGASVGHASSAVTLMNLIRMGNKKVLKKYNCQYLRQAAINVTEITTGKPPHFRQVIYGERALDFWLPGEENFGEFDLAKFFGHRTPSRITDLSTPSMIKDRLEELFGENPQFTLEQTYKMKELLLTDMSSGRKEEYMSKVGVAILFDRAGGKLTKHMRDVIETCKIKDLHAQSLIKQVRDIWDEWDVLEEKVGDDALQFDSFYNGFMARYFKCFRCDETRKGLQALDMDNDGYIDWSEFMVYLKWALRQYPDIADVDELLSVAFCKGLIPAMHDEILKSAI